ncbi:MAG: alanine--glyoxylate aminotransferase family protein [Peptococcaceae bacterium]|nr:alanine--glyoxylate aminotransferase family protein [Peptococcaceae bacterium]
MKVPLLMTPGPTYVHEDVRRAMAMAITNPDLDESFFKFYRETCGKLKQLLITQNDVLILSGEGILGLEAACASLIEPGDRVLCIDNGIYGHGFGDFAKIYGGNVVYFKSDYRRAVDVNGLRDFLEEDHNFKIATLVHCETPSGITNPVSEICPLLKKYGIISIVDSVSAIGGENLKTDEWQMDVVIGGSQKCLSAPPGLTFLSLSREAWHKILQRETPVTGYYGNLANWKNWYEEKWFPYTQPISDIYGLRVAVERLLEEESFVLRHKKIGEAVRQALVESGLELYPLDGFSNTVTTLLIPEGLSFKDIYSTMLKDYNIMIAGAFDFLKDKVVRIGHMGENCHEEKLYVTLKAFNNVLEKFNVKLNKKIYHIYQEMME